MKKRWIVLTAIVALTIALLVPAIAQQTGRLHRRGFLAQHLANELNLSQDQRAQIKAILKKEKPNIEALMKSRHEMKDQLHSIKSFDETAIREIVQQQSGTIADAIVERERIRFQIMAVLTPEQQQKAKQLSEEFHGYLEKRLSTLGDEM